MTVVAVAAAEVAVGFGWAICLVWVARVAWARLERDLDTYPRVVPWNLRLG